MSAKPKPKRKSTSRKSSVRKKSAAQRKKVPRTQKRSAGVKAAKQIANEIIDADFIEVPAPDKLKDLVVTQKKTARQKNNQDALIMHWNGRFGNRMHAYSYAHARAKKFNGTLYLPSEWEGDKLFKNLDHKIIYDDELRLNINQSIQPFDDLDYRMSKVLEFNQRSDFNFRYANADDPKENFTNFKQDVCIDSGTQLPA